MEGIDIEDIGDDIDEFAFEVCGYVLILILELESVFTPSVEELAVDVIDNLFEGILEVFCRQVIYMGISCSGMEIFFDFLGSVIIFSILF